MKPLPTFFVSVKLWLHADMRIWAPSWSWGHQEYKSGGHPELQQSNRAPINWYGVQRARYLRPRCIGTLRSRTQSQSINKSVNSAWEETGNIKRDIWVVTKKWTYLCPFGVLHRMYCNLEMISLHITPAGDIQKWKWTCNLYSSLSVLVITTCTTWFSIKIF